MRIHRMHREAYQAYDLAQLAFKAASDKFAGNGQAPKPDQARALAALSREVERWQARIRSYRPKRRSKAAATSTATSSARSPARSRARRLDPGDAGQVAGNLASDPATRPDPTEADDPGTEETCPDL